MELATRLVAADPLNEDAHVLLLRAFAGTGDEVAVERQLSASVDLFRRELGVEPGPELVRGARSSGAARPADVGARSRGTAGARRIGRGRRERGSDRGRRSRPASTPSRARRDSGDAEIEAAALLALGSALVHATKGKDEEGAAALHRSIAAAETTGQRSIAASAHRELGYVEMLRGDYPRATDAGSAPAEELADGDPTRAREDPRRHRGLPRRRRVARPGGGGVRGVDPPRGVGGAARSSGRGRSAFLGRTHLLRNELDRAEETLDEACAAARSERWTAFIAYPEALRPRCGSATGDLDRAAEAFEHAFALGLPGERRVLGGVRGARARPAPRGARRPGRVRSR